ncbi:MAG TPA: hypothetical protein VJ397_05365 [Thermoplasmata archaeon]|nr:hypothetical protein [Thermoplasmata archaeon]
MRAVVVVIVALAVILLVPATEAHQLANVKIPLMEPSNPAGPVVKGFVNVQMHGDHVLRLVVALKKVEPSTLYTVWLINCADAPGGHPCFPGPINDIPPFGAYSPSPPCFGGGGTGPVTKLRTNVVGNGNTGAIRIDLSGLPRGTYYLHFDIGPGVCHPGGGVPPGLLITDGFSLTL